MAHADWCLEIAYRVWCQITIMTPKTGSPQFMDVVGELFCRSKSHKSRSFRGQKLSELICFSADFHPVLSSPTTSFM